jgi:hypothetical protein
MEEMSEEGALALLKILHRRVAYTFTGAEAIRAHEAVDRLRELPGLFPVKFRRRRPAVPPSTPVLTPPTRPEPPPLPDVIMADHIDFYDPVVEGRLALAEARVREAVARLELANAQLRRGGKS